MLLEVGAEVLQPPRRVGEGALGTARPFSAHVGPLWTVRGPGRLWHDPGVVDLRWGAAGPRPPSHISPAGNEEGTRNDTSCYLSLCEPYVPLASPRPRECGARPTPQAGTMRASSACGFLGRRVGPTG